MVNLSKNIENTLFWTSGYHDLSLKKAKIELIQQLRNLNIKIGSKGVFEMDHKLLMAVSAFPNFNSFIDMVITLNAGGSNHVDGRNELHLRRHLHSIQI